MKLFTNRIDIIEATDNSLRIYIKDTNDFQEIDLSLLNFQEPYFIQEFNETDQILAQYESSKDYLVYLYVKDSFLYVMKESKGLSIFNKSKFYYSFKEVNHHHLIFLRQIGLTRYAVIDTDNKPITIIDNVVSPEDVSIEIPYDLGFTSTFFRYTTLSVASYKNYHLIAVYDLFRKVITIKKVLFSIEHQPIHLKLELTSLNEVTIKNIDSAKKILIDLKKIPKNQGRKIMLLDELKKSKKKHILGVFNHGRTRFFIYTKSDGIYVGKNNPFKVTGHQVNLKMFSTFSSVYFIGRSTHYAYNASGRYETLYLKDEKYKVAEFKRPFKSIPLLRRYGYYRIPLKRLQREDQIHTNLFVGDKTTSIHNFKRRFGDKKVKTLLRRRVGDQLLVIRTTLGGNLTVTRIPFSPEYTLWNRIKIAVAYTISKVTKSKEYNTNLYFEKKSETAAESGFRVFERVMEQKFPRSKNYFILNKSATEFTELKQRFGKSIIAKYSLRHYLAIFNASYFISSELSNHVLNDRLYIDHLRKRLMEVPLVFLQHGIMFAKPVDNPMAFGFHKDKNLYAMYKSVVSSSLEAKEFYKMGYVDEDLIYTGLATLDYAKLNPTANKIAYMPTYRYWEEGLIYKGDIESTSYYKSLMKVVHAFEDADLLDRLSLVPHNKFSSFIKENMPKYAHIISDNPSIALKESVVFITDYSSAIYDAIYRGAYPIFYWEEKEMLINQYQAIPPVNEKNAPGPIAYDVKQLIEHVKHAIDANYQLEQNYKDLYKNINSFDDGKNTDRIIEFLKSDSIL